MTAWRRILPVVLAVTIAGWLSPLTPAGVHAQQIMGFSGDGEQDLEIEADEGIEWRRNEQVYVAYGNARASRGEGTVHGDRLVAYYRELEEAEADPESGDDFVGGRTQIYRVEAIGNVRIVGRDATAYGDHGVYDVDDELMVLTGGDLRLEMPEETVTAEDRLEYWPVRDMAVARGNAMAVSGERRIRAEVLSAHFLDDDGQETEDGRRLSHIEAFENVRITTAEEFARGDRGIYDARTEIAELFGDVKLTRGDNQLNGGYAEVNLVTGVSRLLAAPPGGEATQRVRGLLRPERREGGAAEEGSSNETGE